MDAVGGSNHRPPWSGDAGAGRLFAAVRETCPQREDLPSRLEAGLRAALTLIAADAELADVLFVGPWPGEGEGALDARHEWIRRFGGLLSGAVASDPRTTSSGPQFLPDFLIGGVCFLVARLLSSGEGDELLGLLPGTLESLLSFYVEPGEARSLASVALRESG